MMNHKPAIIIGIFCISLSFLILESSKLGYSDPVLDQNNISEIIRGWPGFTAEEHFLTTKDGYELLIERSYSNITQKTPIIIVHGMALSGLVWVDRGNVSLARLLGELGYDIWILNYRGTKYSRGHVNLTTDDSEYWKFNFNHLGVYDVRSTVRMVYENTNQKALYIGYSIGTTGFFIYSSEFPEEAMHYTKGMIGLAPVTRYGEATTAVRLALEVFPFFRKLVYFLWNGEILPGYPVLLKPLIKTKTGILLIHTILNSVFGDDDAQIDALRFPGFMTQTVDTIGIEISGHLVQFIQSGIFQKYDYGEQTNLQKYGTSSPPEYDLRKIRVPISFFVGPNDRVTTNTTAEEIYSQLQPSVRCGFKFVQYNNWNHLDFIIAKDLPTLLYRDLFDVIKELDDGQCGDQQKING